MANRPDAHPRATIAPVAANSRGWRVCSAWCGHPLMIAAMLMATWALTPVPCAGQPATSTSSPTQEPTAAPDVEAEAGSPVPVLVGGEPVIWISVGVGPYTPQNRAERITRRVEEAVRDRTIKDPVVTVTQNEGSSELRVGPRLLMVVTQLDARALGVARAALAQQCAQELETAIRAERERYAPATLTRSGIFALLATLALVAALWGILRGTRVLHAAIERWRRRRLGAVRVQQVEIVSAESLTLATARLVMGLRVGLMLAAIDVYLTYVLGLFPWTRAASFQLLDYAVTPIRAAAAGFLNYLPNLFFVLVIAALVYFAIRAATLFFEQVGHERIVFPSFPADWADPTAKIVRVLLIAFGVVVAFPYLPASSSPAFAGVTVFLGILISLASSSSLSNMIAGIVLTYTSAFRIGDRVKVGDAYGDIIETSLLATRIRTIKNEEITMPNGIVLNSSVTNYSRAVRTRGLILHTSVTIGYDAPWRTVHQLLIDAALATPGVLSDPPPFVWQTALNDFYVTYEINAYTDLPADMPEMYATMHARIQDAFYNAGVEIMSPHYTSLRDGNTVAIPEPLRSPGYRAPAFRVEHAQPSADGSRQPSETPASSATTRSS